MIELINLINSITSQPKQRSHNSNNRVKPFDAGMMDYLVGQKGKYYNICGFCL